MKKNFISHAESTKKADYALQHSRLPLYTLFSSTSITSAPYSSPIAAKTDMNKIPISLSTRPISYS